MIYSDVSIRQDAGKVLSVTGEVEINGKKYEGGFVTSDIKLREKDGTITEVFRIEQAAVEKFLRSLREV